MFNLIGIDPTSEQNDLSRAEFSLGSYYSDVLGRVFKFVRAEDGDIAAGDVVYYASADGTEVTNDVSGGSRIGDKACGVACAGISDGYYGFIQVSGVGAVDLTTDGNVAAGSFLVGDTSNDGECKPMAADSEHLVFGMALAADATTTLASGAYVLYGNV